MQRDHPAYSLPDVQAAAREGRYWITRSARVTASAVGLSETDMIDSVLALSPRDFYKSMPSRQRPGTFQDVYRPTYSGLHLYVKLQMGRRTEAVVISFKPDEHR